MRRIIFATVLLALLAPTISRAQGRIFQRGETGISGTFDFGFYRRYGSWDPTAATHVHFTYKGVVDLGIGRLSEMVHYSNDSYLTVRVVPLDPGTDGGIGVDGGVIYDRETWYRNRDDFETRFRDLFVESSVRVFWRLRTERETRVVLGLSGLYRFRRSQETTPDGEVLQGSDRGAWGFAADLQKLSHGWLYLAGRVEYAQDKWPFSEWSDWRLGVVGTIGFVIPFSGWRSDDES